MPDEDATSNPFSSPRADLDGPRPDAPLVAELVDSPHAPCPRCGRRAAKPVSFTWWGGFLGPKIFHHVECRACGKAYNGKTGRSNTANIVIYQVIGLIVALAIIALLFMA